MFFSFLLRLEFLIKRENRSRHKEEEVEEEEDIDALTSSLCL